MKKYPVSVVLFLSLIFSVSAVFAQDKPNHISERIRETYDVGVSCAPVFRDSKATDRQYESCVTSLKDFEAALAEMSAEGLTSTFKNFRHLVLTPPEVSSVFIDYNDVTAEGFLYISVDYTMKEYKRILTDLQNDYRQFKSMLEQLDMKGKSFDCDDEYVLFAQCLDSMAKLRSVLTKNPELKAEVMKVVKWITFSESLSIDFESRGLYIDHNTSEEELLKLLKKSVKKLD